MDNRIPPTAAVTPVAPSGPGVPAPAPQPSVFAPTNFGGTSDARNDVAISSRNKKEPRKFSAPQASSISSAPPLLLGVSNLPFYTNQNLSTNWFIPSALVLYALLSELDSNMASTFRFLQSAPDWIPFVSQAYIGILFYVHIFRVAREADTLTPEQFQFLTWFESIYDFRTLMIPGPLVPVFQALAHTSGPFEWIGNIAPHIPSTAKAVRKASYSPQNGTVCLLPSIPLIIDQIQWFQSSFTITNGNEAFIADNFYSNIFSTPAANNSFGSYAMFSPNARFHVPVSTSQYRAFKSQTRAFKFPYRLTASDANTEMSWPAFFRFTAAGATSDTYTWFSTMSATMQRYSQFIRGSVPLSAISLTGLGASIPIWTYTPSTNLSAAPTLQAQSEYKDPTGNTVIQSPNHFVPDAPSTLSCIGNHFDPELEELAEQYSAATQVNVSYKDVKKPDGTPLVRDDLIRNGEVWSLPMIRTSPIVDVVPTHGPLIMTHYHSDTRS